MEKNIIFRINTPAVIWEEIEQEIIAINLENGFYYDISGLSATIWKMLEYYSYQEIILKLAEHYDLKAEEIKPDVNFFLKTLEDEKLMVFADKLLAKETQGPYYFPKSYTKPVLNKYTDMENLLLIDPIHEVDEHGWPNLYPLPQTDHESC